MPSPEATLLGDFLLAPAPLRDFVTLRQFTDIFPRGHRDKPAVQQLYRELQRLRERDMDAVRRDIASEAKRSKPLRHAYAHERRQLEGTAVAGLDPVALQTEQELASDPAHAAHTLHTVHADVRGACQSLEAQLAEMELEHSRALLEVRDIIGSLSDLRHGRFAPAASGDDIGDEVVATLKRLEAVCLSPPSTT